MRFGGNTCRAVQQSRQQFRAARLALTAWATTLQSPTPASASSSWMCRYALVTGPFLCSLLCADLWHLKQALLNLQGHASVPRPLWKCSRCGHRRLLLPPEIGYFPATPGPRPCVLYSRDLLHMTSHYAVAGGPLQAAKILSRTLAMLHASNGCSEGEGRRIWRYLDEAAREWRIVHETVTGMICRWASCAFRSTVQVHSGIFA